MKITVIYGTNRTEKSSTYNIAQQFLAELSDGDPVTEFHLPKDMPEFCTGCFACFSDPEKCPHYKYIRPISDAILNADLIIIAAPVYVFHMPGLVKALLDHFGYQWIAHRPIEAFFHKQALVITTAAGAGMRHAVKDVQDSFNWWGVGRTYTFKKAVQASEWSQVTEKKRAVIAKEVKATSQKIRSQKGSGTRLKVRMLFYLMRFVLKKYRFIESDAAYWEENGWLDGKKPW
ncbi:NAD(P)H-dependent oxidoreductase [uncultured Methanocorpusculum sp.]|nr:NAD(P)H-dependent oxidoreductase [uncultured Methanocorpusculum sp.]